ncbi:MAG: baseplate J/gp47 family protein [Ardenticatenales bacterium]|nr:baseplate J/gp47 family protein [Ardenticatenales bacterium]
MADFKSLPALNPDGTSQRGRRPVALDPAQAPLEARSLADWLAFARAFARQIYFYDVVDGEVKPVGDWRGFLPDELDLDELITFMENPDHFPPGRLATFNQPHQTLFLAFLRLLRHIQAQFNALTGRHLDYYYRELLRLTPRPAQPHQVHVLLDLNETSEFVRIPAGTAFQGGADDAEQPRLYHSVVDQEINQIRVGALRALYVDRQLTGIEEWRPQHKGDMTAEDLLLGLLRLALGQPAPGDPLPLFAGGQVVNFALLRQLERHVTFVATDLFLDLAEYHSLHMLKQSFDGAAPAWREINDLLTAAGRRRTEDNNFDLFQVNPQLRDTPRDFDALLLAALGRPLTFEGDALSEVDTIDQLYRQSSRADVQAFVRDNLYFPVIGDFVRLMDLKTRQDAIWQQLMAILGLAAGRRARAAGQEPPPPANFAPAPAYAPDAFATNLAAALGATLFAPLAPIQDLAEHKQRLDEIESYFLMTAEQFATQLMGVGARADATEEMMQPLYTLLQRSHVRRQVRRLQDELMGLWERPERQLAPLLKHFAASGSQLDPLADVLLLLDDPVAGALLVDLYHQQQEDPAMLPDDQSWNQVWPALQQAAVAFVGQPRPYQETWHNLYALDDPRAAAANEGWPPFGRPQLDVPEGTLPGVEIGWALRAPLLALRQGERILTLTLDFEREAVDLAALRRTLPDQAYTGAALDRCPLRLKVTTQAGWLEPVSLQTTISLPREERLTLTVTAHFDRRQGALGPMNGGERQSELQLLLRQLWLPHPIQASRGRYVTVYQQLRDLKLRQLHLAVSVTGLVPQLLLNDDGEVDGTNPFEPFGPAPSVGSRFIMCDRELLNRQISSLAFQFQWMGRPADLATHYRHYRNTPPQMDDFQVDVGLQEHGRVERLLSGGRLFRQSDPLAQETLAIDDILEWRTDVALERFSAVDQSAWPRSLIWELAPLDFLHRRYPGAAAERAIALSRDMTANQLNQDPGTYLVEPPYTPKMKDFSLGYSAAIELPTPAAEGQAGSVSMAHVLPFGQQTVTLADTAAEGFWLPQLSAEGSLYIGLQGVRAPQGLALLFQLAEGSADPNVPPADLRWAYLSGDRWRSLDEGQILSDETRGLLNSGIVRLQLPAAHSSQQLPANLYWLRLTAGRHTRAVANVVAIHTQALTLRQALPATATSSRGQTLSLPAHTISNSLGPIPEVAAVRQPYPSYGGRSAEAADTSYTRFSERLRHRQRALTIWDYEHLLLAEFPDVYKVKCLPAAANLPGQVTVVVIPDSKQQLAFDPFEPKMPAHRLADIQAFLADKLSPFALLTVQNPHYERLKIRVGVRFRPGYRPEALRESLNGALNRFLAPWAYDDGAELVIGGSLYASQLIRFVEEQPYIDYVSQIKLFRSDDGENYEYIQPQADGYAVTVQRPNGILVAARTHEIDILAGDAVEEQRLSGINFMKIELDFEVG